MASIVHRRIARDLPPRTPRGPGASLDALTWVGWLSALGAFGFLVFGLRPLTELGDPRSWAWESVGNTVLTTIRNAAIVGLPAALEWGVPGARRRTPWLVRGTVLLALEQVARPALEVARERYFELVPEAMDLGFDTPAGLALMLVSLAVTLVGVAGAWALSDGLADAGARLRRAILVGVVAAGTALSLAIYLPLYGVFSEGSVFGAGSLIGWLNLAALALGFVDIALWIMVGARLVAGLALRLRPRRAWFLGALAGALVLGYRFLAPVLLQAMSSSTELAWALRLLAEGSWIVLLLAFAAGLGRGRDRREAPPRRLRLFVLDPTD